MEYEAWLNARITQAERELSFREIRKGVQAIQADYLGRLKGRTLGGRAMEGRAKRAAFATFYAAIHHATVYGWLQTEPLGSLPRFQALHDLGCGTGAVGAAVARSLETRPELRGLDQHPWAVSEARDCYRLFGLRGGARRGTLPGGLPRIGAGELIVAGWSFNELDDRARESLIDPLKRSLGRGAGLLLFEPISEKICPWWSSWVRALQSQGAQEHRVKFAWDRPEWIRRMDRAAKMNHSILSARVLTCLPGHSD
jgi:hypothetical protein